MIDDRRPAHSLVELLIVIGLFALLFGLLLPAVQKVRDASQRIGCGNNLKQIGLACTQYHDILQRLPPGVVGSSRTAAYPYLGWQAHLLPYLDQDNLWRDTVNAFRQDRFPFDSPPHSGLATPLPVLTCPTDERVAVPQTSQGIRVALTSYPGNEGTNARQRDGVLFLDSAIPYISITDGLSNTLLAGERPPAPDFRFGWWYAGVGQRSTGSLDMMLGVREFNLLHGRGSYVAPYAGCPAGPYAYQPGQANNPCDVFHYWSFHTGGANFLFADGSVHFLTYSADAVLPALATRSGGEVVDLP
jgi:prepilin-type processing-associated H-X9-DG protein